MKASRIIALAILSATSSLIAKPFHQPSIGFEEAIAQLKKTPKNDFNAVTFYLPEKTPGIKNAYSFLTRKADSTILIYADNQYLITYEYLTGDPFNAISAIHIWNSKNYQYISSVLYKGYSLDPPSISVGANGYMAMETIAAMDRGPSGLFGFSVVSNETEVYEHESTMSAMELAKSGLPLRKKAFAQVPRINQAQNINISLYDTPKLKKLPQLTDFVNHFGNNGERLIRSINFDTLEYTHRKAVKTIPSIANIPGLPENEEFDYELLDSCNGRYLFIYPKEKGSAFSACQDAAFKENHNIYLRIYNVASGKLSPAPQNMIDCLSNADGVYPNIGESDCGKITINLLRANRWTNLSGPMLFDENTGKTKDIQMEGIDAERYSDKKKIAYKMYGKIPNPESVGTCLSSWNSIPGDSSHSYWLTAGYGVCALYYVDEQKKIGKLVQSWQGNWGKTPWAKATPNPVWMKEKQMLFLPVRDNCWDAYVFHDFSKPAEKKFSIFTGGENDWAIVLPDGRYAGSPGCEKLMILVNENGQACSAAPYAPWKNRPAEVLEAIGGNEDDIEALKATTKRWLAKKGFNMDAMPPEPEHAEFAKVEVGEQELMHKANTVTFPVQVTAGAKKAMTALQVRVNGAEIRQEWSDTLLVTPGSTETAHVSIPLESGQNMIELVPIDSTGIEGVATTFRMVKTTPAPSKLYVVTLGVSDYDQDELDLQFAAKDAKDLRRAFARYGSGEVKTLTLTDKEVNDKSVLKKVQDFLSSTKAEDRVVLYLAGHGMLNDALEYHYAPAGFDPQKISETGISMDALVACLQTASARERLLILDTCHSGTLGEEGEDKLASSGIQLPHGVRAIQNRGMKLKKATGALTSSKQRKRYIEDMFSMGNQYRGVNIIAGAAGAEYALESGEWNNGVFTASLIQLLKDCVLADKNGDGYMSVQELAAALQTKVHQLTGGAQKPNLVASASPYTALSSSICSYVINKDWDAICHRIRRTSDKRELTLVLDSFLVMNSAGRSSATADEIEQKIKELENKRHSYSEEEKAYLRAVANVIFKHRDRGSYPGYIPYKVWACAVKAGLKPRALLQYQDVWEYDHRTALKQLAEGKKATSSANSGELAKLQTLIGYLRAANYTDRTYQLYQRRLLAVLPIIANGGYIDTKVDAVLKNSNGTTALHNACGLGHYELVEWLLRNGANVNTRATNGATPVQCVGDDNDSSGQIRALLSKYGASTTGTSSGEAEKLQTLIGYLRAANYTDRTHQLYLRRLLAVLPIIANGGYVNTNIDTVLKNSNGTTALHNACGLGYYELVEWLLRNGANVHARSTNGATPEKYVGDDNDPRGQIRALLQKYK